MVRYRRNRIAGATYFFTVTLRDRRSDLLVREIDALRDAWRKAAGRVPHTVIAAVILPDHLHAVIRMDDWPYSTFHRYVSKGWLPADWAAAPDATGSFGEPR